ncbi:hypothetical protein SVA_0672 [Sulfurifustis variabilis]|uniref:Spermatogenesis-associated protein 20-like TRX domain-containing protein n=1 Tax=Sulfurifustis variabilis TaxID=1675686 RepID=A0A1B4VAU4_9GAMM|nr:DUF255 domain-containing protein [Sulfurifustis variabilis]BAU47251.1 hypothetical protein SVA_0672 [Sulfurifustis variabilis]
MTARVWKTLFVVGLLFAAAEAGAAGDRLANHPSPYLAMHAGDPVAWREWGPAAVGEARREQKLLFVSVGYFSCHWCHVMQRESYRDPGIAAFLNSHFVPVKVDRELEPALDAELIRFAEATRGSSGWPLNVFVTPDGHPVYALLYAPPAEFRAAITELQALWTRDRARLGRLAEEAARVPPTTAQVVKRDATSLADMIVAGALSIADPIHGGFGDQSKFPSVPPLDFLLARQAAKPEGRVGAFLGLTLDEMARNGLQDHVGGGFFRYAVDPGWNTPHFEKMLYDNALLARLYLRAARVLDRPDFARVARRTLDFLVRDMRAADGAFIASLSALDEKGVEGGYYLWRPEELERLVPARDREVLRLAHGMTDAPPFDAGWLPVGGLSDDEIAARLERPVADVRAARERALGILARARGGRGLPRDTKRLAGWNGLALATYAEAARTLGDARYRGIARGVRDYLAGTLWDGARLHRSVAAGRALGAAALEDYAYVAQGLLEWARLTGRKADYALAGDVARSAWRRFDGPHGWRLAEEMLLRVREGVPLIPDGALPSPAAVLVDVSLALSARTGDGELRRRAVSALDRGRSELAEDPFWHATHVSVLNARGDELRMISDK